MSVYANKTPKGIIKDTHLGRIRDTSIYVGIVKRNDDAQRMGRIAVWIPELGGEADQEQSWFVVSYASPFAGVTPPSALVKDSEEMEGSQSSYGFWMQPPDLDNHVLVCFANGDSARGFWFACVFQQNMNHMVPGIPSGMPTVESDTCSAQPPVVEYNKASDQPVANPKRPVYTPLHEGLSKQGLYSDPQRGPTTAGARREAPSKVFGWNTPRGNTIYVDDNPDNEFIRFRTRGGAQVLLHDTEGYVYINSKTGNSWVQVSDYGIDAYSAGPISMRSEGSINLHADASLNIEADGNLNLRAGGNLTLQSANHTYIAGNGNLALNMGGSISGSGDSLHLGASGEIRLGSGGDMHLGSGGASIRGAAFIHDNDGTSPTAPDILTAAVAPPRELPDVVGVEPCYTQETRKTITRRMPTHEPYQGHVAGAAGATVGNSGDEFATPEDQNETQTEGGEDVVPDEAVSAVSDNDADWLAICVYTEAAGESDDGKAAVAQVIKNRLATRFRENALNPAWNGQIKQFVLAYAAFSFFWSSNGRTRDIRSSGDVNNPAGNWWRRAEQRGLAEMNRVKNQELYARCKRIAQQVLAGTYQSSHTGLAQIKANRGCYWYANLDTIRPMWIGSVRTLVKVGHHTFFVRR